MSDIYKNRQPMPMAAKRPKRRRRRSSVDGVFDEEAPRRRRSRNSGIRRLFHIMRKPHNEKRIWMGALIASVIFLISVGIWQFIYKEYVAREQARKSEFQSLSVPETAPASAPAE